MTTLQVIILFLEIQKKGQLESKNKRENPLLLQY